MLFSLRLPVSQKTVPYDDLPLLITKAKHGLSDVLEGIALEVWGANWRRDESELEKAAKLDELELVDSSHYPLRAPFTRARLEKASITVESLRRYLARINGMLVLVEDVPAYQDQTSSALKASVEHPHAKEIRYRTPMFPRLLPSTRWRGGMIAETDVLTLDEAARFASKHAGTDVTASDFLRAAGRGQIPLRAIVNRSAKLTKHDGGVFCNGGTPVENFIPSGSIPTLPLTACQHLAAAGHASWRTFDGFENVEGELLRFTAAMLLPDEPDLETVPQDCRVTGNDVHAVADAFIEAPAQTPSTPAPVLVETTEQRRARWLDWYGKGERGAVQRVYERELLLNPKADRSFIGKQIDKAREEKTELKRGGAMFGQLVQNGKRKD